MTSAESLRLAALTTAAWTAVLAIWLIATVWIWLKPLVNLAAAYAVILSLAAWLWLRDRAERRSPLFAARRYAGFDRKGGRL